MYGHLRAYFDTNRHENEATSYTISNCQKEPRRSYNERPAWLDLARKKLDAAVLVAYGWPADLSHEQIFERLLALNLKHAVAQGGAAAAVVADDAAANG